jgi:hypothetical protein
MKTYIFLASSRQISAGKRDQKYRYDAKPISGKPYSK